MRYKLRSLFVAALCVFAALGQARAICSSANCMKKYIGKSYAIARVQLIAGGFQPVHLKHSAMDFECLHNSFCEKYPEVMDCANDTPCAFVLRAPRSATYIVVFTFGDARPTVTSIRRAEPSDMREIKGRL